MVLDVAGLAVDAVGGVDDELHVSCIIWLVLVHPGRTEPETTQHITEINYYSGERSPPTASPALRPGELGPVDILRNLVIEQREVRRLVGFVVCS